AILDGPDDAKQHPAGHTAPAPRAPPRLAFAGLVAFDVAAAEGPGGQAKALRFVVPPTCPGQGKTRENGCICLEHNALPPLSAELREWNNSEATLIWRPATTSRTAWARRKTRAALVCLSMASKVVTA